MATRCKIEDTPHTLYPLMKKTIHTQLKSRIKQFIKTYIAINEVRFCNYTFERTSRFGDQQILRFNTSVLIDPIRGCKGREVIFINSLQYLYCKVENNLKIPRELQDLTSGKDILR